MFHDDQYLRLVVGPGYLTSELIRDRWPGPDHAVGLGVGGGVFNTLIEVKF